MSTSNLLTINMKSSNQSLKHRLSDYLLTGQSTLVNRSVFAIVGMDDDWVRVTDDQVHYFSIRGICGLICQTLVKLSEMHCLLLLNLKIGM